MILRQEKVLQLHNGRIFGQLYSFVIFGQLMRQSRIIQEKDLASFQTFSIERSKNVERQISVEIRNVKRRRRSERNVESL